MSGNVAICGDRPAIAYSATSQIYLVVWRSADYQIWGARLDVNGNIIGSAFQISPSSDGARDPNVAWNSSANQFGVLYTGWGAGGTSTTFSLVSAGG